MVTHAALGLGKIPLASAAQFLGYRSLVPLKEQVSELKATCRLSGLLSRETEAQRGPKACQIQQLLYVRTGAHSQVS